MRIIELNQYYKKLISILRLAVFSRGVFLGALILVSCEKRLGRTPAHFESAEERTEESMLVSVQKLDALDVNELIQYLKIEEKANWLNISEDALLASVESLENNAIVLELVSDFYFNQGNLERALYYNSMAEDYGANTTEFYKKRANIYAELGQYGLAVDYINKAVMINGNDPDIYLTKGEVYMKLGDSISALKYKEQAFRSDSSRKDIAADLAYLYENASQNEKANHFVDMLIAEEYHLSEMNYLKVNLLRKQQMDVGANQILFEMLEAGDIEAGEELVNYFGNVEMYDSMIYYSTQVLNKDSTNMKALEAKAVSFDRKGYFASSLMYYNQMLAIDSLNKEALEGIGKVNRKIAYLRKLREQREAIPTFDFASPRKETN